MLRADEEQKHHHGGNEEFKDIQLDEIGADQVRQSSTDLDDHGSAEMSDESSSEQDNGLTDYERVVRAERRFARIAKQRKKRLVILNKWFRVLKYFEIKKVLIRLKSRKYLVSQCPICLQQINNDSRCRMLNCYHIFHS